jgi:uncharacterized protein YcbK (DUF882 family)
MMKSKTRRQILKIGAKTTLALFCPLSISAAIKPTTPASRSLSFYNTHTKESLYVCYFKNGRYDPKALRQINFILRDHRTGDIRPISKGLLNLLTMVASQVKAQKTFHVISGYRSPATNAMLHSITSGVARKSLHMAGKAIDIRVPNYSTLALRDLCINMNQGGVGYYSKSNFVHLDIGQVRCWSS